MFKRAAQQVVKIAHQYYDDSDDSVLPRSIATKEAFENAMTMDVAMGGSTNTVLHILAMAQSADVDFTLDDIERISHTVPCICKASPPASGRSPTCTVPAVSRHPRRTRARRQAAHQRALHRLPDAGSQAG
ncbi:MAG: dihydroxy-acid dehydratase [Bifidobacterium breve]